MKTSLNLVAALALSGFCLSASAQATKPTAKAAKTETTSEEKTETTKQEKTVATRGAKTAHHGGRMHQTKTTAKRKM